MTMSSYSSGQGAPRRRASTPGGWKGRGALVCAAALAAALLAGCISEQKDIALYRSVLGNKGAKSPALESTEALSLDRAFEMASLNNEMLALKGEDYVQALIDKDRAVAAFLPTVTIAPVYVRQQQTKIPGAAPFVPPKALDVTARAAMDFNPVSDTSNVRAAGAQARSQKALLLDLKEQLLLDVASTYYQVLRSEAQVQVLSNSVVVQEKRVEDIRNRANAGVARPLDVYQAEAQLAATRVTLVRSTRDAANGRSLLALLIGAPEVGGPLADSVSVPAHIESTADALRAAWENRQDLKAAEAQVAAAGASLKSAWGRFAPNVSLDLTYYLSRESFPNDIHWMAVGTLAQPVFRAGLIRADIRAAMSRLRQAWLAEAYLHRRLAEEIAVACGDLDASSRALDQLTVESSAADEALRQSERAVEIGTAVRLDQLVAQDQALSADLAVTSERLTRKVLYMSLLRTTGQLDMEPSHAHDGPQGQRATGPGPG